MRRPWATFALATAVLLVGLVSLPEQLPLLQHRVVVPPSWLARLAEANWPLSLLIAPFVPLNPLHALIAVVGLAVAGFAYEPRFGRARTVLVFVVGALISEALFLDELLPAAGTGGVMALFGGRLLDMARRGESRSLFGPLVGPLILHGAMEALVPGEWGPVHALGFAAGAVLTRALPPYEPPSS